LLAYVTAAGAGILATSQPAKAGIIYTPSNATWNYLNGPLDISLTNNGITDFQIFATAIHFARSARIHGNGTISQAGNSVMGFGFNFRPAFALSKGFPINASQEFQNANGYSFGYFHAGLLIAQKGTYFGSTSYGLFIGRQDVYLGVRFEINGQEHYGWIGFAYANADQIQLTGYAYDTVADQGIVAGQTPEPPTLGLLALGALGIGLWRRKHGSAKQA
jgi:hypothetical protein